MEKQMIIVQTVEGEREYEVVTIPTWPFSLILLVLCGGTFVWPLVVELIWKMLMR